MKYVKAPSGWSHADKNPFNPDGAYGPHWSCFCLHDSETDQFFTGAAGNGLFSARFGRRVDHLENRLIDFLRYENSHGRTVILSFPEDVDIDGFVARALSRTPDANTVRSNDPLVVVHSTTMDAWESISAEGRLRAASRRDVERCQAPDSSELSEVARYYRGEPAECGDYVMLGGVGGTSPEAVLASKQAGRFVLDEDAIHEPGVRLYFDNHRIITDGLGTRDGVHLIKVYQHLPLTPYLLAAISVDDVQLENNAQMWTPRTFVAKANEAFSDKGIHW